MKSKYLIFILLSTLFISCNKESYIETVGRVTVTPGDDETVGHYIFKAKGAVTKCGGVEVFVDNISIGNITIENTANVDCLTAPVTNKILRVVVTSGSHKIKAIYKDNCKPAVELTHSIEAGKCQAYDIL